MVSAVTSAPQRRGSPRRHHRVIITFVRKLSILVAGPMSPMLPWSCCRSIATCGRQISKTFPSFLRKKRRKTIFTHTTRKKMLTITHRSKLGNMTSTTSSSNRLSTMPTTSIICPLLNLSLDSCSKRLVCVAISSRLVTARWEISAGTVMLGKLTRLATMARTAASLSIARLPRSPRLLILTTYPHRT